MTKRKFTKLMKFPREWMMWGFYPDELFDLHLKQYQPGHENASEHYRFGAFHWWLHKKPSKEQLLKLVVLTWLDPEKNMAGDARNHIAKSDNCDKEVRKAASIPTRCVDLMERSILEMPLLKENFTKLMKFPSEWITWGFYPDELFYLQSKVYELAKEKVSAHYRYSAFYWWLRKNPPKEQLIKLGALARLDPEYYVTWDIYRYITDSDNCDEEVKKSLTLAG